MRGGPTLGSLEGKMDLDALAYISETAVIAFFVPFVVLNLFISKCSTFSFEKHCTHIAQIC